MRDQLLLNLRVFLKVDRNKTTHFSEKFTVAKQTMETINSRNQKILVII